MKPRRLSRNSIERAACPPDARRIELPDAEIRGLRLFVHRGGSRIWYLTRKINGRNVRMRLGEYPVMGPEAARQAAMARLSGTGKLKGTNRDRSETLLYMCRHAERNFWQHTKTGHLNRGILERYSPTLLNRRIATIERREIRAVHAEIGRHHPTAANRWLEVVRRLFTIAAIDFDHAGGNPAEHVQAFPETKRDRRLTAKESQRLLAVLDGHDNQSHADLVRLALFTGARRTNVFRAATDQFDLDERTWTIPASEAKSGRTMLLPLEARAVAVVARRIKQADGEWLFPGRRHGKPMADFTKPFAAILKTAKITGLRFHDLRRSLASFMADTNASEFVVATALCQSERGVTGRYARPMQAEVRKAIGLAIDAMGGNR